MNIMLVQILCFSLSIILYTNCNAQTQNPQDKNNHEKVKEKSNAVPPDPNSLANLNGEMYSPREELPRFPACENQKLNKKELENCAKQKMLEFVYKNLVYPKQAKENGIEGMAVVQFYIDTDGAMLDLKLVRDLPEGCGKAALDVMRKMQSEYTWIPGKQGGKLVKVQYTLPIKFKL